MSHENGPEHPLSDATKERADGQDSPDRTEQEGVTIDLPEGVGGFTSGQVQGDHYPLIGATLSHFEVSAKVGEGGMGQVYLAHDTQLERKVALKVLPALLADDPDRLKRLKREARALAALDHPNIVPVYSFESADGVQFLTMAFIEGETLDQLISPGGLSLERLLELAVPLADALRAAHENGIIHRDLKPANVMIDRDDRLRVLDFGLAKRDVAVSGDLREMTAGGLSEQMTREGTILGTYPYMSPEQAEGRVVDARSDLFSLGIMLYEMACGHRPFKGETGISLIASILRDPHRAITDEKPDLPARLGEILDRCLAKDPDQRYPTAEVLRDDLDELRREAAAEVLQPPARSDKEIKQFRKIAVLPFVNMSADKDQEYFCDGITEELINTLAKISAFQVTARTSAFSFKGKNLDIRTIGKKLNVEIVVEGSVRKAGDKLRITAQLINVADGFHIWSETYNRTMLDVFAIQDEISLSIVEELKVNLLKGENSKLKVRPIISVDAYNLYLQGRYYWNKRTKEASMKSLEIFQLVIEKDPSYALAYAGIADCYIVLQIYAYFTPREAFPKARAAAEKALEIDPSLAEAHTSLAWVKWSYDLDWSAGEKEFMRALELNPSYATGHHWYSIFLTASGRHAESLVQIKRAYELDPLSLMINTDLGFVLFYGRQEDLAIEQYRKTLEMDKSFVVIYWRMAMFYAHKEMYNKAFGSTQNMKEILGEKSPLFLATLGYIYALEGKRKKAEKVICELSELSKDNYVSSLGVASIYLGLEQKRHALRWLERAYEERDFWMTLIKVTPTFYKLHYDPRFKELLKKMNLE